MIHALDGNNEANYPDVDDDVDDFDLPCKLIGDLRLLNAEIKESKERREHLVTVTVAVSCRYLCVYMHLD